MLTLVQNQSRHFHWDSVPLAKPITGTGMVRMVMGPYGVLQSFNLLNQALRSDIDSASPSNRLAHPEGANNWEELQPQYVHASHVTARNDLFQLGSSGSQRYTDASLIC